MAEGRGWDIALIGGASGSGKTCVARRLAGHYGLDLVRVDDFQALLEAVTTAESHPDLHYWRTHPAWREEGARATVGQLIRVGELMSPGLAAVVRDHLEEGIPMVLEGDFILPQLAASVMRPRVRAVFLHEPDREQLEGNYLAREGTAQPHRAQVSHLYGSWLAGQCHDLGIPVVQARPWSDQLERVLKALG